jgi:hypothetical protein
MYICSRCDKAIKAPSPVASYEEKFYHPDCLACNTCSKSLNGKQFIKEKNGNLLCEECNMKTAPKCKKCSQVFAPGVTYKKLGDQLFYHNECFRCVGPCRGPIGADFYELDNNEFLCVPCYDKYGNDFEKYVDNNNDNNNNTANNTPKTNKKSDDTPADNLANLSLNTNNNSKPQHQQQSSVDKPLAVQRQRESDAAAAKPAASNSSSDAPRSQKSPEGERLCAKCNQKLSGKHFFDGFCTQIRPLRLNLLMLPP